MVKKYFAGLISILLVGLSLPGAVSAQSDSERIIRSKVQTLALERDKKIEVKLRDKTKIKGYITSVDADSFTVTDSKTVSSNVFYNEVDEVKRANSGFSAKTWLILGGVAAGTVATCLIVKPAVCDGGAQTRGIC